MHDRRFALQSMQSFKKSLQQLGSLQSLIPQFFEPRTVHCKSTRSDRKMQMFGKRKNYRCHKHVKL
jgi:hypothetical protein